MNKKALVTELEQRYTVVKHTHALQIVGSNWMDCRVDTVLDCMATAVDNGEVKPYECIVIESDWPEYAPVKEALLARINGNKDGKLLYRPHSVLVEGLAPELQEFLRLDDNDKYYLYTTDLTLEVPNEDWIKVPEGAELCVSFNNFNQFYKIEDGIVLTWDVDFGEPGGWARSVHSEDDIKNNHHVIWERKPETLCKAPWGDEFTPMPNHKTPLPWEPPAKPIKEWLDSNYDLRTLPADYNAYRDGWTSVPKDCTCVVKEGLSLQFFQLADNCVFIKKGDRWDPTGYENVAKFYELNGNHIKWTRDKVKTKEYLTEKFKLVNLPVNVEPLGNWTAIPEGANLATLQYESVAFHKYETNVGPTRWAYTYDNGRWMLSTITAQQFKERRGRFIVWQRDPEIVTALPDVSTLTNGIRNATDMATKYLINHPFAGPKDITIDGVRLPSQELNLEFKTESKRTGNTLDQVLQTYWEGLPAEVRNNAMIETVKAEMKKHMVDYDEELPDWVKPDANEVLSKMELEDLPAYEPNLAHKYPHYHKDVSHLQSIDVYRVLELFGVSDQAIGHAVKKLLCAGQRGAKNVESDMREAADTLNRRLQMLAEDENKHGYDRS